MHIFIITRENGKPCPQDTAVLHTTEIGVGLGTRLEQIYCDPCTKGWRWLGLAWWRSNSF